MSILAPTLVTEQWRFSQEISVEIDNPIPTSTDMGGMFRTNGPQAVFIIQDEILGTVSKKADGVWAWERLDSARLPSWDGSKSGVVASKVEALLLASGEKLEKTEVLESDKHRQVLL